MNIRFPLHNTGFDSLQEEEKKEAEKIGEEVLCKILYLENSDKARFADLKKRIENDYMLNKAEYPRKVTKAQSLLLNYQPNYKSHRNFQSNGVSNQLMFAQRGKLGKMKATEKRSSRYPGEIWTTSPATNVKKKVIIMGTKISQLKPGSNKMQRLS